jgi:hypothetical protein
MWLPEGFHPYFAKWLVKFLSCKIGIRKSQDAILKVNLSIEIGRANGRSTVAFKIFFRKFVSY